MSVYAFMADKNSKLAKENIELKETISKNISTQESLIKTTIKAEYFESLAYKSTLQTVDENIRCIEECLEACKRVREVIVAGHKKTLGKREEVLTEVSANIPSGKMPDPVSEPKKSKKKKTKKQDESDVMVKRLRFHKK